MAGFWLEIQNVIPVSSFNQPHAKNLFWGILEMTE